MIKGDQKNQKDFLEILKAQIDANLKAHERTPGSGGRKRHILPLTGGISYRGFKG